MDPRIPPAGSEGRENAEYQYLHVHTESHENVDPVTMKEVEIIKGYNKEPRRIVAIWADKANFPTKMRKGVV